MTSRTRVERERKNKSSWGIDRKVCRRGEKGRRERGRRGASEAGEGMGEGQLCSGKGWEIEG